MNWITRILDFISPRQCVVCGQRLAPTERSLCSVCLLHLPRTTYQFTPDDNPMVQLFWHLTPIRHAAALLFYEPRSETARIVYDLKYHDHPEIGNVMGRMIAREFSEAGFFEGIDVIVPVPLSRSRQFWRGYNQSLELARGISNMTGIPVARNAIRRLRFNKTQTHLGHTDRRENVDGVFQLKDATLIEGRHVLLVDDVITTGATMTSCAQELLKANNVRLSLLSLGFVKAI
jgi:ComF family protein